MCGRWHAPASCHLRARLSASLGRVVVCGFRLVVCVCVRVCVCLFVWLFLSCVCACDLCFVVQKAAIEWRTTARRPSALRWRRSAPALARRASHPAPYPAPLRRSHRRRPRTTAMRRAPRRWQRCSVTPSGPRYPEPCALPLLPSHRRQSRRRGSTRLRRWPRRWRRRGLFHPRTSAAMRRWLAHSQRANASSPTRRRCGRTTGIPTTRRARLARWPRHDALPYHLLLRGVRQRPVHASGRTHVQRGCSRPRCVPARQPRRCGTRPEPACCATQEEQAGGAVRWPAPPAR